MKREIFEVYAKVIDANGAYNTLSGYPKVFDSHQNGDDIEKARSKAYGEYHTVLGTMYNRFDRQQQIAMIIRASDGLQIEKVNLGTVADLPDPQFAVVVNGGSGSGTYTINTPVIISADVPQEGKVFDAWQGADGLQFTSGNATTSYAEFIMPNNAVELTATYKDAPTYDVTVENGEGDGTYAVGASVTIEADVPETGMKFDAWEGAEGLTFVDGDMNSAEATFVMPNNDVTVTATYEAI